MAGKGNFRRIVRIADPDDSSRLAKFDDLYAALRVIGSEHGEVHEGHAFSAAYVDLAMGNADTFIMAFKTPAGTKRVHLVYFFDTLTGAHLDMYKDSTWTADQGDPTVEIFNRFQTNAPSSSALLENTNQAGFVASNQIIIDPTNHVPGTEIMPPDYAFALKGKFQGKQHAMSELILEVDTLHSLVMTSDAASNKIQLVFSWYEHQDD